MHVLLGCLQFVTGLAVERKPTGALYEVVATHIEGDALGHTIEVELTDTTGTHSGETEADLVGTCGHAGKVEGDIV